MSSIDSRRFYNNLNMLFIRSRIQSQYRDTAKAFYKFSSVLVCQLQTHLFNLVNQLLNGSMHKFNLFLISSVLYSCNKIVMVLIKQVLTCQYSTVHCIGVTPFRSKEFPKYYNSFTLSCYHVYFVLSPYSKIVYWQLCIYSYLEITITF